jgi:hypothetical protein
MTVALNLIYTHNVQGDLNLLPRLYTQIQQLRSALTDRPVYMVDLGRSCMPEVWPCGVTEGRAALVVFDAMGYHAANVSGVLSTESRAKLASQVSFALVDKAHPFVQQTLCFAADRTARPETALTVSLFPAERTRLEGGLLTLRAVEKGQIGLVQIREGQVVTERVVSLTSGTLPDPTIAGTVDFVVDEARYYEKRRGQSPPDS